MPPATQIHHVYYNAVQWMLSRWIPPENKKLSTDYLHLVEQDEPCWPTFCSPFVRYVQLPGQEQTAPTTVMGDGWPTASSVFILMDGYMLDDIVLLRCILADRGWLVINSLVVARAIERGSDGLSAIHRRLNLELGKCNKVILPFHDPGRSH